MQFPNTARDVGPFKQRGFTLQGVPAERYAMDLVKWMADQNLNRLEVPITSHPIHIQISGYPEMCMNNAQENSERYRRFVDYGRSLGVRIVPVIRHSDGHFHWVKVHPEWRVQGSIPHPSGMDLARLAYCFRNPGVIDFYRAFVRSIAADLGADEVQFWFTENRLWCECPRCCPDGAPNPHDLARLYYRSQSHLFVDSVERARSVRPGLEVSIWTTQGSAPFNDDAIRGLPKDVLWFYYDGERRGNYNLRRIKTLPADILALRADGHRIGAQLDFATSGGLLTTPGRIGELCQEAAEAGLEAVAGWIRTDPLNPEAAKGGAHPVLAYAAEMLRNPAAHGGPTLERVMRDAAVAAGHSEPVASAAGRAWRVIDETARVIHLSDTYSYWWAGTNVMGAICQRIVRRAPADELDQRWVDGAWADTIPELDDAAQRLRAECEALESVADESGYLAALRRLMLAIREWGRVCRWCIWAGIVYHRMGSWDTTHGPWRDDREEMLRALREAADALERLEPGLAAAGQLGGSVWPIGNRIPVLKQNLREAIQAAEAGASPSPLPRQDRHPYAT